jgi:hydrogenase/urease accessory protein HupE
LLRDDAALSERLVRGVLTTRAACAAAVRVVVATAALAAATRAAAHQGGLSYADVAVHGDTVDVALHAGYVEWLPVVDVDADRDGVVTTAEARARLRRLAAAVRAWIGVSADGRACTGEAVDADAGERLGALAVTVRVAYRCPAPIRTLRIVAVVFARQHPGHRVLATVRAGAALRAQHVFGPGSETLDVTVAATPERVAAVREFFVLGVEHIFTGYDHVLFLVGLLLVAPGLRSLLGVVTAFTAAHTVTLVAATLGWAHVDVRLVESVIALSIAWVAAENLVVRRHRRRWLLALVFGLVHGFGFSNVLREMAIPRDVLGWSLASFNVGVEVGQVAIVGALYPLLAWSRRQRWNAWAVRAASVAIGLMGLYWFVERALLGA